MAISSAATLALDLLAAAPRLGLQAEDAQWITILDVLLESVPTRFQQARMSLCRFEGEMLNGHTPDGVVLGFSPNEDQDEDYISASVWVKPGHDTEKHSPAHVNQISLIAGFVVAGDAGPQSFDALRDIVDSPHFDELRFWVREGNALDEQGTRSLLRSLLRREQLTWALERGILWLQLCSHIHDETDDWDEVIVFDSSVLLSVLADRSYPVIDDTPQTLDDTEYAELLSLFNVQKMNDYLRRLPALRAERAAAKARSMVETSDSPGTQNAAAIALPAGAAGEVVDRYEEAARAQEGEDHGVKS
ncbi:hypothetical protein PsYK624_151920 [Phanerochaete sordida]|uniref:HNH nuclease domain-containing protein n=1 Tax=Phanerochaete sordida TaxID=48140 RepID=A0A9P3GRD6_9APHY|nr:hypothetical protein PsYK624_151920 [Phanerochaete sordida]